MPVNFSELVYEHAFDTFGRTVTFTPRDGQPYSGRGIFNTVPLDVMADDGTILSDQKTILDILEIEFTTIPQQRDTVFIPEDSGLPELGEYEIIDANTNGGGETTLTLRKVQPIKP